MPTPRRKRKQRARSGAQSAARVAGSEQRPAQARERPPGARMLGTVGERPPSPFGGLPVSELLILVGGVAAVVGLLSAARPALFVGLAVVALGVIEVTAREHFSGYRSHTTLLAAIPTVAVEVGLVSTVGARASRGLLLLALVPVFAGLFFLLRRAFLLARQRRVARR